LNKNYSSVSLGSKSLRGSDIYALVVIPHDLEKNTLLGHSPQVSVFYNSQYILIGKLIKAAIVKSHLTFSAGIDTLKNMSISSPVISQALGESVPIQSQISPLFNSNNHYGQFLVSGLIPAIWQILIIATTVLAFGVEQRKTGIKSWLGENPTKHILVKLLPCGLVFWLQGGLFFWALYYFLDWPMHGHWFIVIFAQLLTVIACQSVAAFIFFITLDTTRSMSLVAGFSAPAFAFMGVTFPTTDMPILALVWRAMIPISHYIEIQLHQVNYGTNFLAEIPPFISLMLFVVFLFIALFKAKRLTTNKESLVVNVEANK
jgi:ABC-2 type transport system permease protein